MSSVMSSHDAEHFLRPADHGVRRHHAKKSAAPLLSAKLISASLTHLCLARVPLPAQQCLALASSELTDTDSHCHVHSGQCASGLL